VVIESFLGSLNLNIVSSLFLLTLLAIINISWIFLFFISIRSHLHTPKVTPRLGIFYSFKHKERNKSEIDVYQPFVSIIVPARNEQENIERCIISLLNQDYPNFEVIFVDDNSTDKTLEIVQGIKDEIRESREGMLKIISLTEKPDGWTGKTWASEEGYLHSIGNILLFTDADTFYMSGDVLSRTISYMQKQNLDVLTGSPLIELRDFWSKIAMPLWNHFSIFLGRNTGALNNPMSKVAYLVGGFFLIRKKVLKEVGTFRSVRGIIQEDAELGMRIKKAGFNIKIVRIDDMVSALWSRNLKTIWDGIARTFVSMNKWQIFASLLTVFFMTLLPFVLLPYTLSLTVNTMTASGTHWMINIFNIFQQLDAKQLSLFSLYLNIISCLMIVISTAIKDVKRYKMKPTYSLLCMLGAGLIVLSYIKSIVILFSRQSLPWRERTLLTSRKQKEKELNIERHT
jgi:chlorobactene glucosyltransferase